MYSGIIKWVNLNKKIGFIEVKNGADIFFHFSAFNTDKPLNVGTRVQFNMIDCLNGVQACDIAPSI